MASNTPFKPKQDKEYKVDQDTVNAIIKKRIDSEYLNKLEKDLI